MGFPNLSLSLSLSLSLKFNTNKVDNIANFAKESNSTKEEPTLLVVGSGMLEGGNVWYLDLGARNQVWKDMNYGAAGEFS